MDDLSYVKEHFNPEDPRLVGEGALLGDGFWKAIDQLVEHCPVARTDSRFIGIPDGGWVVSGYDEAMEVINDPGSSRAASAEARRRSPS